MASTFRKDYSKACDHSSQDLSMSLCFMNAGISCPLKLDSVGHDFLLPIGIPAVGFEYLGIYDQSGVLWYWTMHYDGELEIWNSVPTHLIYEVKNVTPALDPLVVAIA